MKLIEELDYQFDFDRLHQECVKIYYDQCYILANKFNGVSIQHRRDTPAPFNQVDGLLQSYLYENYTEKDFNVINKFFVDTEIEKIVDHFNLYRTRILLSEKKSCYTIHRDNTWRLHIPIETNKNCMFFFPDYNKHFNLETSKIYKVNTKERHTFLNCSDKKRLHFVGCLYD